MGAPLMYWYYAEQYIMSHKETQPEDSNVLIFLEQSGKCPSKKLAGERGKRSIKFLFSKVS